MESQEKEPLGGEFDLNLLFNPATFAHVGASSNDLPGRYNYTAYLKKMNFKGRLYPVNPKYEEVLGFKCYPSLAALPEAIDVTVLALPAPVCVEILQELPEGKLKFVVIHTSGFGEINRDGLQQKLINLGKEKGFRIVGPNCMGVYSRQGHVGFWDNHHEFLHRPGAVGFISQSGGIAINMILASREIGLNFDKVISLGNQVDVSINEMLAYMGEDEDIRVIGLYVEDVKDGRVFHRLVKTISRRKPVLIWKGGLSEAGKAAALSHTGSLAGNETIFFAAMQQAGAIIVDNFQQTQRALRFLQPQFPLPGKRMGLVCGGGGMTVNIGDLFSMQPNLRVPRFTQETREGLQSILPEENVDIKNPVDPGSTGWAKMDRILRIIGRDPRIDALLMAVEVNFLSEFFNFEGRTSAIEEITTMITGASAEIGKPIFINIMQLPDNREDYYHHRRRLIDAFIRENIPWTEGSFKEVAETFNRLAGYRKYLDRERP